MTDGILLIHADDRIGASGMQPKSPFAPPPPTIVPPSDGIGLQAAAGHKPVVHQFEISLPRGAAMPYA